MEIVLMGIKRQNSLINGHLRGLCVKTRVC